MIDRRARALTTEEILKGFRSISSSVSLKFLTLAQAGPSPSNPNPELIMKEKHANSDLQTLVEFPHDGRQQSLSSHREEGSHHLDPICEPNPYKCRRICTPDRIEQAEFQFDIDERHAANGDIGKCVRLRVLDELCEPGLQSDRDAKSSRSTRYALRSPNLRGKRAHKRQSNDSSDRIGGGIAWDVEQQQSALERFASDMALVSSEIKEQIKSSRRLLEKVQRSLDGRGES